MGIMNKFIQEHMDIIDKELRDLGTYLTTEELHELAVIELKRSGPVVEDNTEEDFLTWLSTFDVNKIEKE